MKMKPSASYIFTAAFLSYTAVALFGYPAASIQISHDGLWISIIFFLGTVLTIYSSRPKSEILFRGNCWLILSVCLAMLLVCWIINHKAVEEGMYAVTLFSIFTLGAPIWLVVVAFISHLIASRIVVADSTTE